MFLNDGEGICIEGFFFTAVLGIQGETRGRIRWIVILLLEVEFGIDLVEE
jgi:hypothetical protein